MFTRKSAFVLIGGSAFLWLCFYAAFKFAGTF